MRAAQSLGRWVYTNTAFVPISGLEACCSKSLTAPRVILCQATTYRIYLDRLTKLHYHVERKMCFFLTLNPMFSNMQGLATECEIYLKPTCHILHIFENPSANKSEPCNSFAESSTLVQCYCVGSVWETVSFFGCIHQDSCSGNFVLAWTLRIFQANQSHLPSANCFCVGAES